MADKAKDVKEPGDAIQSVAPVSPAVQPVKAETAAEPAQSAPEVPASEQDPDKAPRADRMVFEKRSRLDEEIVFEDGGKYKFSTPVIVTLDRVLAGKLQTVSQKYDIHSLRNDYGLRS